MKQCRLITAYRDGICKKAFDGTISLGSDLIFLSTGRLDCADVVACESRRKSDSVSTSDSRDATGSVGMCTEVKDEATTPSVATFRPRFKSPKGNLSGLGANS
jgi:hypothetical protein